ncbi:hypothetical protein HG531_005132 [Fusarium graminearum]|nr:hypothetical protein HG531_005132 [Fusarium graminearum]
MLPSGTISQSLTVPFHYEAAATSILNKPVFALKRFGRGLVKSVVLEMLLAIILLLLCSTGHQASGASYGRADTRKCCCIEIQKERGKT